MTNAHIEFAGITKSYGPTKIIGETSVSIGEGEFVSLLGPSGSGKSTMLNMIAGLAFPSTGQVLARGKAVAGPGPDRGVVFQNHALLPWMTARGNIEFGLRSARPELSKAERAQIAQHFLDEVSLGHAADRRPSRLSGGMQQRVGLARAFAIGSDILLLDEPFGALDALTRRQLQSLLLNVWEENRRTVVMVTHDVDEAVLLSDRILVMSPGPAATIIEDIEVGLPRPRSSSDDSAVVERKNELRERLLGLLENG
ncbi:ATP-binding cassette domain-containing protein [Corynebacterium macginleyi]|uniref:ABC transporter ATP-binding protein n=1 Tax=Corynebacterium macginleyi TaxID=38290 RepID=UPI00190C2608|nr:ABC transporter ATP-binding protein [Corynebacterium macginleyi]MBK4151633.1 ATP-binding cassette domain-containing protein [Corynebacterium macginleyi]MBK4152069.1 ATP-binding cassette domain-containing protein [Corynebacterium macginleyi]MBK4162021.1 ATP-binding cassette domain-containing protein [Corynebacterium macginleyi]MBK4166780.1 ATP-binding cassette domain-containing protein [Corynebacterium macginleyi]MBK4179644.1 ATP-binding cassette domain-containing protein [Corynebacterium ma